MHGHSCLRRNIPMHGEISMYIFYLWEDETERPNGGIQNDDKEYGEPVS